MTEDIAEIMKMVEELNQELREMVEAGVYTDPEVKSAIVTIKDALKKHYCQ